ncbi:MAG: Ig-like domain-containing protein [Cyclobacteriaceae bacterium]|jgi:hypothetical protein|nr:Ig-like domain-containing protein [Cyclobacteriaceae bacterium]
MKKYNLLTKTMVAGLLAATALWSCSEDDPAALTLVSLTAEGIDLNGATTPSNVPTDAVIIAEFSTEVDPASAAGAISLLRDYDDTNVDLDIQVSGKTVTITPETSLTTGALYALNVTTGLKSTGNQPATNVSRNFNTEGTFAVPGAIAHWTFEDSPNDIFGTFNAAASGVVDITYAASRRAEAGKAASFNGTTSIIEIPNGDDLMNNGDWVVSFWVKPSSANSKESGHFVFGLSGSKGFQYEIFGNYMGAKLAASYAHTNTPPGTTSEDLWCDGEGNLGWQGWTFSKDFTGSGGLDEVIKDKWVHIVCMYNSTTRVGVMYINGEKVKEQDFDLWPNGDNKRFVTGLQYSGQSPNFTNDLAFGFICSRASTEFDAESWGNYASPTSNHFQGLLDDVIIYHKLLTPAEITLMYNSGKP